MDKEHLSKMRKGLEDKTINRIFRFSDGDMSWKDRIDSGIVILVEFKNGEYQTTEKDGNGNIVPKAVYNYFLSKNKDNVAVEAVDNSKTNVNLTNDEINSIIKWFNDELNIKQSNIKLTDVEEYIVENIAAKNTMFINLPSYKHNQNDYDEYIKTVHNLIINT